jgi:hypothetical protein
MILIIFNHFINRVLDLVVNLWMVNIIILLHHINLNIFKIYLNIDKVYGKGELILPEEEGKFVRRYEVIFKI